MGRKPCGSRTATRRSCVQEQQRERALGLARRPRPGRPRRARPSTGRTGAGRPRCRSTSGRWRPARSSHVAQLALVDEVAVVADGDLAVDALDEDRLGVDQAALAGRRVAHVADGRRARQVGQRALVEDVGDVAHSARQAQVLRRPTPRCRRSPARDAAGRRGPGRSASRTRHARRSRRCRTRP